jgi:hypothetical protein
MDSRKKTLIAILNELHFVKEVALIAASYVGFEGIKQSIETLHSFGLQPAFVDEKNSVFYYSGSTTALNFRSGFHKVIPSMIPNHVEIGFFQVDNKTYRWSYDEFGCNYRTSMDENVPDLKPRTVGLVPYYGPRYLCSFTEFRFVRLIGTIFKNEKAFFCMEVSSESNTHIVFLERDTLLNNMRTFFPEQSKAQHFVIDKYIVTFTSNYYSKYDTDTEQISVSYFENMPICSLEERIGDSFRHSKILTHLNHWADRVYVMDGVICLLSVQFKLLHFFVLKEGPKNFLLYVGSTEFSSNALCLVTFPANHKLFIQKPPPSTSYFDNRSTFDVLC